MFGRFAGLALAVVFGFFPSVSDTADGASLMGAAAHPTPAMLPDRLLECTLGRITNFDPSKDQRAGDFTFEGQHAFKLFLPSIPVRTTEPPPSTSPPEPVDARTRIVADPDGLARDAAIRFNRVIDYWPERVEMTAPVNDVVVKLIIIAPIDVRRGTADLFMTNANDAVTWDHDRLYAGRCRVVASPARTAS